MCRLIIGFYTSSTFSFTTFIMSLSSISFFVSQKNLDFVLYPYILLTRHKITSLRLYLYNNHGKSGDDDVVNIQNIINALLKYYVYYVMYSIHWDIFVLDNNKPEKILSSVQIISLLLCSIKWNIIIIIKLWTSKNLFETNIHFLFYF